MDDVIVYEVEEGIGVLRVNRPEARNALNWRAQERFAAVVESAAADDALRALIITGHGPTFVSGGDLKELAGHPEQEAGERLNRVMGRALARLAALPVPVFAAINGDAAGGGCEIALACDLRLVAAGARLHFVQVRLGLTTGWGGGGRLVRLVGQSRALALLLGGRSIDAAEAQRIGLVHRVVPAGEDVLVAARAWAADLVEMPRDAVAAMKQLLYAAGSLSAAETAAYERELFVRLWAQPNHREAVAAFLEKRRPHFNRE